MNILDDLTETYRYGGSISFKAMEDDIATLENQIDGYNITLNEIRLRKKNDQPILKKIQESRMRLSLLQAAYKREKARENQNPENAMLGVLGISGKEAKGTDRVDTAAEGKEPKPQNFDASELEMVVPDKPTESITGREPFEERDETVYEIETDESTDVICEDEGADIEKEAIPREKEETEYIIDVVEAESREKEKEIQPVQGESEIEFPDYDTIEETREDIHELKTSNDRDLDDLYKSLTDSDKECVANEKPSEERALSELIENEPIIENKDVPAFEIELNKMKTVENKVIEMAKHQEEDEFNAPPPTLEDYYEPEYNDYEPVPYVPDYSTSTDSAVLDMFPVEVESIRASVSLADFTGMVNTENTYTSYDLKNRTLTVVFYDLKDYTVFLELLKEKSSSSWLSRIFSKKRPSIFMYVTVNEVTYTFEFTKCRISEIMDSTYSPGESSGDHQATVTFKYKKLKIEKI